MKKVHEHRADPWGCRVLFTQDSAAMRRLARQYDLSFSPDPETEGLCWNAGSTFVIWVARGAGAGALVHECTHASLDILDWAGITAHQGQGEPMCYTLQRMVERFLPHLLPPTP
ncbi:hypothetical protein ACPUER_11965 [Burkholderia sp. DN3021]|uniref:hypothetical protein n=1 Tax=Burkholderia sp. DN3021 TaxID=3410137 RepID=UPI003C7A5DD8